LIPGQVKLFRRQQGYIKEYHFSYDFRHINDSNGNYGTLSKIFHLLKTKCSSNINNFFNFIWF